MHFPWKLTRAHCLVLFRYPPNPLCLISIRVQQSKPSSIKGPEYSFQLRLALCTPIATASATVLSCHCTCTGAGVCEAGLRLHQKKPPGWAYDANAPCPRPSSQPLMQASFEVDDAKKGHCSRARDAAISGRLSCPLCFALQNISPLPQKKDNQSSVTSGAHTGLRGEGRLGPGGFLCQKKKKKSPACCLPRRFWS